MTHDLHLGHDGPEDGPICRRCGREITGEAWARMEDCPRGCTHMSHIYLNGSMRCACGLLELRVPPEPVLKAYASALDEAVGIIRGER